LSIPASPQEFLEWVVSAILVIVVVEGAVLLAWRRHAGRGPSVLAIASNLAAGFFLVAALKLAMLGVHPVWILTSLALALVAHLADLASRWAAAG